jgi:hypothetical protein
LAAKEKKLSSIRLGQIHRFKLAAEEEGWANGTSLTVYEMAAHADMTHGQLARVKKAIKERPSLGMSVSTSRGPQPRTVVSFSGTKLESSVTHIVDEISEAKAKENFQRVVREACTSFVAFKNSDKSRTGGRHMKIYHGRMREFLSSLREQSVRDGDPYKIRNLVETALAVAGVYYADEEE